MTRHLLPLILVSTAIVFAPSTQAAVIVANTGASTGAGGQVSPSVLLGVRFITPTVATELTSATGQFESGSGSPNLTMSLYNELLGVPGSSLATLGNQTYSGLQQTLTFTPGSPVALAASTAYYLIVACTNCASGVTTNNWHLRGPATLSGLAGSSASVGIFGSVDSGATWSAFTSSTPLFQVNGNVLADTPEPATFGLVTAALALGAWLRKK